MLLPLSRASRSPLVRYLHCVCSVPKLPRSQNNAPLASSLISRNLLRGRPSGPSPPPPPPLTLGARSYHISASAIQPTNIAGQRRGIISKEAQLNQEIVALGRSRKWKEILQLYSEKNHEFRNIDYATTLSQLGRIPATDTSDPLFESFVFDLADKLDERGIEWMGVRQAANVVHAVAKMELKSAASEMIIEFIAGINAKTVLSRGNTQAVANIAWALGKLECSDVAAAFFVEVEKRAEWLAREGKPQAIANTAWACATLGIQSPNIFAAIEKRAKWLVDEGDPQAVSNIAWACGTLGAQLPKLFAVIEERAEWLVHEGNAQNISNTAWACGTLDIQSPKLFAAIEEHAGFIVREGTTQEVANTLWAFGKLQYHAPKFLDKADTRGSWLVESGTPQNISNSALAFAQLGYEHRTFLDALAGNVEKLSQEGNNAQVISNTCYALCILDQGHSDMLSRLWNKAMCLKPSGYSSEGLQQLAQVYAFCEAAGIKLLDPSQELLTLTRETANKSDETISRSQSEVSSCLRNIGVEHEVEVSPFPFGSPFVGANMLAIDMASKQHSLALEYDGDHHFLREVGTGKVTRIENGTTKAKRRFLQRLGWNVVNIHYLDWIEASKKGSEESFLRKELHRQLKPSRS